MPSWFGEATFPWQDHLKSLGPQYRFTLVGGAQANTRCLVPISCICTQLFFAAAGVGSQGKRGHGSEGRMSDIENPPPPPSHPVRVDGKSGWRSRAQPRFIFMQIFLSVSLLRAATSARRLRVSTSATLLFAPTLLFVVGGGSGYVSRGGARFQQANVGNRHRLRKRVSIQGERLDFVASLIGLYLMPPRQSSARRQ